MLKKLLFLSLVTVALFTAPTVGAKTICTQEYGQPVVCKEIEEEVKGVTHEPVATGFADVSFATLGTGFLVASFVLLVLSKRKASASIFVK